MLSGLIRILGHRVVMEFLGDGSQPNKQHHSMNHRAARQMLDQNAANVLLDLFVGGKVECIATPSTLTLDCFDRHERIEQLRTRRHQHTFARKWLRALFHEESCLVFVIALTFSLLFAGSPSTGRYGHVAFANSGAPAAQTDFLDGLAMLHDFEYPRPPRPPSGGPRPPIPVSPWPTGARR